MGKRAENIFFTDGFAGLATCNNMVACSQEPTTYAEANATYALARVSLTGADFAEADGDTSGRKITIAAKTLLGEANGNANHIALIKTSTTTLYYVTTSTQVTISNGVGQDYKAFKIELADPAA